ncbi:hypothetical protein CCHR01_03936 [Colletotrichum chrysophilum]|uniref:Uncharacterized protein n=1 Tax=Colletotrichum chrysophilum TaxID=1836956 RepID=A0AAD9ELY5_9PEZI|nr:hypothetical protein CCHR01_03936 [Colletotrichum chrysophilum]
MILERFVDSASANSFVIAHSCCHSCGHRSRVTLRQSQPLIASSRRILDVLVCIITLVVGAVGELDSRAGVRNLDGRVRLARVVIRALRFGVECASVAGVLSPVYPDSLIVPVDTIRLLDLVDLVEYSRGFKLERLHEFAHPLMLVVLALDHSMHDNACRLLEVGPMESIIDSVGVTPLVLSMTVKHQRCLRKQSVEQGAANTVAAMIRVNENNHLRGVCSGARGQANTLLIRSKEPKSADGRIIILGLAFQQMLELLHILAMGSTGGPVLGIAEVDARLSCDDEGQLLLKALSQNGLEMLRRDVGRVGKRLLGRDGEVVGLGAAIGVTR